MPTNARTLTLAGESIEPEDWPEGSSNFVLMDDPSLSYFTFRDLIRIGRESEDLEIWVDQLRPAELAIACAVARCWHLDRAEDLKKPNGAVRLADEAKFFAHLASAAKWARISKGA